MGTRVRLLAAAGTAGLLALTAPTPHQAAAAVASGDLQTALAGLCAALAAFVAALLGVSALLVLATALPGRAGGLAEALARRCLPPVLRAALVTGLGLSAAVLPASAAGADRERPASTRVVPDLDRPAAGRPALTTVPAPTAPPPAPTAAHPAPPSADPAAASAVLVRPGDSLWAIAARALGPRATDRAVAAAWPRWWAANRAVIGDDPDLIRPGQQLTPPTSRKDRP